MWKIVCTPVCAINAELNVNKWMNKMKHLDELNDISMELFKNKTATSIESFAYQHLYTMNCQNKNWKILDNRN